MQNLKDVDLPSRAVTFTQNNIPVSGDILKIILSLLEIELRYDQPKVWGSLKRVCKGFNSAIMQIEAAEKICFFNHVDYQEISPYDDTTNLANYYQFYIHTSEKLVVFKQLGRDTNHFWAPFLTCNPQHQLNFYEIKQGDADAVHRGAYHGHTAKLTAAISLDAHLVVSADESGAVAVWSTLEFNGDEKIAPTRRMYNDHKGAVSCIDFLSATEFVTGSKAGEVITWDINSVKLKNTLKVKGSVLDLRAISRNELLVLTLDNLSDVNFSWYHNNRVVRSLDFRYDSQIYNFFHNVDVRIASETTMIGISSIPFKHTLSSVNFTDPKNAEIKKMEFNHPQRGEYGFFSRGNYYSHAKRLAESKYLVTICQESAKLEEILPYRCQ
jgi:hypothetical protein